ncbi:uncharacterized protein FOMMEDRAFT_131117 [Fomitiporia mediterranea MF3/22]|uniref:uncharacterized protein n=1 Tax=Fomitiporia mediterranea (strain MF3/22) TaxID=694068 RepID=UPI00044085A8|nr:uncharacterized protein FOMMEDRAFT_131117 [Fomitiporia mediterranea MF3/22]EJD08223.1 hypothetical protein FOMMEDRAFT_131117 [Fomitiporia mediterranea MF3/22]
MSTVSPTPRRRLSSRRGSSSAPDPYGLHADIETTQGKASRITILPVRSPPPPQQSNTALGNAREKRSSWGSTHSTHSAASNTSTGRGRLSFAFSSFTPINKDKDGGDAAQGGHGGPANLSGPPSPGGRFPMTRRNSSHSLDRTGQRGGGGGANFQQLSPQQVCDLAISSISNPPLASPSLDGRTTAPIANQQQQLQQATTPFLVLSDEVYLPFLERPAEVTALLTSAPTNRLMALLQQTFPKSLRDPFDANASLKPFGEDPAKWSFAELTRWLQTVDREEADDRVWVSKARKSVLARSELIWSRLKAALGVPPELEEEEEDGDEEEEEEDGNVGKYDDGEARVANYADDDYVGDEERERFEAWLEPIYDGDMGAKCVASPVNLPSPSNPFDLGSIGEGAEDEEEKDKDTDKEKEKEKAVEEATRMIHGLRLSTPLTSSNNNIRARSGSGSSLGSHGSHGSLGSLNPLSMSPVVPTATSQRRAFSSTATEDTEMRRREAMMAASVAKSGRVRRSAQQERGTGDPLFPSSFATLTMGPSLVANNPALRSGPRRTFRPGVPIAARGRGGTGGGGRYWGSTSGSMTGGWDTDGNDYALSLGSGSERSFR